MRAIPTINFDLLQTDRQRFLAELKDALFEIGFFYLENYSIDEELFENVKKESIEFFNLPQEEKDAVGMIHSKHFLGYNKVGDEITAKNIDWREQIDIGTELPEPEITSDDQRWRNIEGPNIWPNKKLVPGFRPAMEKYIATLSKFSQEFLPLIEESLGLESGCFLPYFKKPVQQAKIKLIKYPDLVNQREVVNRVDNEYSSQDGVSTRKDQGCGEHRDSDFFTFIYQATNQTSLQVKYNNQWINVPPRTNTLVFATGTTLEYITKSVCVATIHRVLTPVPGEGDRISIPFFQTIDVASHDSQVEIPESLQKEVIRRDASRAANTVAFQFPIPPNSPVGYTVFLNRVKSHPKVGERWYPDVLSYVKSQLASA